MRLLFDRVDEFLKKSRPVDAVRFKLERRLQDNSTNRVRYNYADEVVLSLNVPEKSISEQYAVGISKVVYICSIPFDLLINF